MATNKLEFILSLSLNQFDRALKTAVSSIKQVTGSVRTEARAAVSDFRIMTTAGQQFRTELEKVRGTAGGIGPAVLGAVAAIGGGALFGAAARSAFSFNSTLEQSRIGIAALIRTFTGADLGQSFTQAEDIQHKLQIAGLKTTATYEQLLTALQEGIGPALREGFSTDQIVKFTTAMTQTAGALSVPLDQLGQEIRSVLDATISDDSRIAKALGVSNEDIKRWRETGTVFQELETRLKAFVVAGDQAAGTLSGKFSNMMDAIQMAFGKGSEKTFAATTAALGRVQDAVVSIDAKAGTFTFNEKIMAALDDIDQRVSTFLESLTADDIAGFMVSVANTTAAVVDVLGTFAGALVTVLNAIGPFGPMIVKLIGWMTMLSLGWKTLAFAIKGPVAAFKGVRLAMATLEGLQTVTWLKQVTVAFKFSELAAMGLRGVVGGLSGVFGAALAGWQVGTWLNKFDIVKKAGTTWAHSMMMSIEWVKLKWAEMTGGDTDGIKRQMQVYRDTYQKTIDEIDGKVKDSAAKQKQAHADVAGAAEKSGQSSAASVKKATDAMKDAYKKYADEVKKLQEDIAGREQSLSEQLREMSRSGMSDVGAWKDRKAEAEEYAMAAKRAAEEANRAFASGDMTTGQSKAEEAVQLYDKAKTAAADLNREVKSGDQVVVSQQEALKTALAMVEEYGRGAIGVQQGLQEAIKQSAQALDAQSGGQLSKEFPEIARQLDDLKTKTGGLTDQARLMDRAWANSWNEMVQNGKAAIQDLDGRLITLTRDRHMKIFITNVEEKSTGGLIGFMRGGLVQALAAGGTVVRNILAGGWLPGFGGGDTVPLLGERGEVMLNKYAVRAGGLRAALAFNAGKWDVVIEELLKRTGMNIHSALGYHLGGLVGSLPGVQALATGGAVMAAADAGAAINYSVVVNYSGSGSRQDADHLANTVLQKIEEMNRRRSR